MITLCELKSDQELVVMDESWANAGRRRFAKGTLFTIEAKDSAYVILREVNGPYVYAGTCEVGSKFDCVTADDLTGKNKRKLKGKWGICNEPTSS